MKKLFISWQALLVVVSLAAACGLWFSGGLGAAAVAQTPPEFTPLDEVQLSAVRNLIKRLNLDRDAMIALNPTAAQAESVLSTVRTWQETNVALLASLKLDVDRGRSAVRRVEKAIRMGPADPGRETEMAVARRDFLDAKSAYTAALAPLEASVSAILTASQRDTWAAIKTGWGQQMPVRMLDLSDAQRLSVSKAKRTSRRLRAAATDKTARDTAVGGERTAMDGILTVDQKSAVAGYYSNYAAASAVVAEAMNAVLVAAD